MGRGKNANHRTLPFLLCSWDRPRLPSFPQTRRGSKGRDKRRKEKTQGRVNNIRGYMERKRGGNKTGDKNWERKEKNRKKE